MGSVLIWSRWGKFNTDEYFSASFWMVTFFSHRHSPLLFSGYVAAPSPTLYSTMQDQRSCIVRKEDEGQLTFQGLEWLWRRALTSLELGFEYLHCKKVTDDSHSIFLTHLGVRWGRWYKIAVKILNRFLGWMWMNSIRIILYIEKCMEVLFLK